MDFVIIKNGDIVPVEVKSSEKGSMKSMTMFLESHPNSKCGVKISLNDFSYHNKLVEIPFYGLEGYLSESE